jgi:deoxyadenosine/deoxycytidine kinase
MMIAVEGVVGCGKSSALKALQRILTSNDLSLNPSTPLKRLSDNCSFIEEPVQDFQNLPDSHFNPLFEGYKNNASSCDVLTMQLHIARCIFCNFARHMMPHRRANVQITERCPEACKVFAEWSRIQGNLTDFSTEFFNREWESYAKQYGGPVTPSLIIFIDVSPEVVLERIQKRSRREESGWTLEKVKSLRFAYLTFLNSREEVAVFLKPAPTDTPFDVARCIFDEIRKHLLF